MSFQPRYKSNNWFNFYKSNPKLRVSNSHLGWLHHSSTEGCSEAFDTFANLTREEGVFLLSVAPNWWVLQVLHQADMVGRTFENILKVQVAFWGNKSSAIPDEIEVTTSLVLNEDEAPGWLELVDPSVIDNDSLLALPASTLFSYRNLIGIPNVLAQAFLGAPLKDPVSIFYSFHATMLDFNEANAENERQELFQEESSHILQFCWLAAHEHINPMIYTNSEDPFVLCWAHDEDELNIQPLASHLKDSSSSVSEQQKFTHAAMRNFLDDQKKEQQEDHEYKESKKPSFKWLHFQMQNLIVVASAVAPYQDPAQFPIPCMSLFLEQPNIGKAAMTLQQESDGSHINFCSGIQFNHHSLSWLIYLVLSQHGVKLQCVPLRKNGYFTLW